MDENVDAGVVTGAGAAAHLLDVAAGVGLLAGAGACEKVGFADKPMDAKMSSSAGLGGAFFAGAAAGFLAPRLVIANGAPPIEAVAGLKGVLAVIGGAP